MDASGTSPCAEFLGFACSVALRTTMELPVWEEMGFYDGNKWDAVPIIIRRGLANHHGSQLVTRFAQLLHGLGFSGECVEALWQ